MTYNYEGLEDLREGKVMEELKRCPFCGGEARIISDHIEYEDVYAVLCKKCGASVGLQIQEYGEYRPCYLSVPSLIAAWNRRTQNIGKKECCKQNEEQEG